MKLCGWDNLCDASSLVEAFDSVLFLDTKFISCFVDTRLLLCKISCSFSWYHVSIDSFSFTIFQLIFHLRFLILYLYASCSFTLYQHFFRTIPILHLLFHLMFCFFRHKPAFHSYNTNCYCFLSPHVLFLSPYTNFSFIQYQLFLCSVTSCFCDFSPHVLLFFHPVPVGMPQ